jgi:hypothetical protein
MKTINVRTKNSFAITETRTGQVTGVRSVDGEIQNVVVSGTTGVVTARKDGTNKNYVYDLERGTVMRIYSV